ncbi:hypothetical protein BC567DRAFT_199471, partial [Phyllosticta citribraziliensis]
LFLCRPSALPAKTKCSLLRRLLVFSNTIALPRTLYPRVANAHFPREHRAQHPGTSNTFANPTNYWQASPPIRRFLNYRHQ